MHIGGREDDGSRIAVLTVRCDTWRRLAAIGSQIAYDWSSQQRTAASAAAAAPPPPPHTDSYCNRRTHPAAEAPAFADKAQGGRSLRLAIYHANALYLICVWLLLLLGRLANGRSGARWLADA